MVSPIARMESHCSRERSQLCGDCLTGSDHIDSPELPYARTISVLRQVMEGTPDARIDKLLIEFLTEADPKLQNASPIGNGKNHTSLQ